MSACEWLQGAVCEGLAENTWDVVCEFPVCDISKIDLSVHDTCTNTCNGSCNWTVGSRLQVFAVYPSYRKETDIWWLTCWSAVSLLCCIFCLSLSKLLCFSFPPLQLIPYPSLHLPVAVNDLAHSLDGNKGG